MSRKPGEYIEDTWTAGQLADMLDSLDRDTPIRIGSITRGAGGIWKCKQHAMLDIVEHTDWKTRQDYVFLCGDVDGYEMPQQIARQLKPPVDVNRHRAQRRSKRPCHEARDRRTSTSLNYGTAIVIIDTETGLYST